MVGALLHLHGYSTVHFSCRSNLHRLSLLLKPPMVQMGTSGQASWASLQADIETHIKQAMPVKEPLLVYEAMHHLVFAAPRTTVPALCVAACELVGGRRDQALPAASALLLVGHHVYGPNVELFTRDRIVPLGFELLVSSADPNRNNSDRILRVIVEISRAVGSEGMLEGQYRNLLLTPSDGEELRNVESIKHVTEKIEGGLHACGAACGAVLGGGSEEDIEKLRKYGFYVGMIQGMLQRVEIAEKGLMEEVEELRNLALKELEVFEGRKIDVISSFINV